MSSLVPHIDGLSMKESAEKLAEEEKSLDAFVSVVEEGSSVLRNNPTRRYYIDSVNNSLLTVGIIGSPNCGKSALYNLMTKSCHTHRMSMVENAIFTTMDPFIATYTPYDERMEMFKRVYPNATSVIPIQCTVIDTPAIIAGAFKDVSLLTISSVVVYVDLLCTSIF